MGSVCIVIYALLSLACDLLCLFLKKEEEEEYMLRTFRTTQMRKRELPFPNKSYINREYFTLMRKFSHQISSICECMFVYVCVMCIVLFWWCVWVSGRRWIEMMAYSHLLTEKRMVHHATTATTITKSTGGSVHLINVFLVWWM